MDLTAPLDTRAFSVPPFADACLEHASDTWAEAFDHPFVHALADGTLDADTFKFYQMQDARYLEAFADAADKPARTRAKTAFTTSVRYEWMFWNQAWTQQEWPV